MKNILRSTLLVFGLLGLGFYAGALTVHADEPVPSQMDSSANYCEPGLACDPSMPPARRYELAGPGAAMMGLEESFRQTASPEAWGEDDFRYFWDDTHPFRWIDATKGTDTGMRGSSYHRRIGPIALPFSFRFYENKYDAVFIEAGGMLSFDASNLAPVQGRVPDVYTPNTIIAPYWAPFELVGLGKNGRVYYDHGGTAPNRYFVVQWNNVKGGPSADSVGKDDTFRFEVILYENGNIEFEYAKMDYVNQYWCGTAGMENAYGLDGLKTLGYCKRARSGRAITITRPQPRARSSIYPPIQGNFVAPGTTVEFHVPIRNTGDFGTDNFNVVLSSPWIGALFAADGITPLSDTNGDNKADTGPLAEGETANIVVKVQVPGDAVIGSNNLAHLYTTSTVWGGFMAHTDLRSAVPGDFAQAFHTYDDHAMSFDLIQSGVQNVVNVTGNDYYGTYPGILALANGQYVYAWQKRRCVNAPCTVIAQEIEYTLLDHSGGGVTPIRKIKNLRKPKQSIYQYSYGMHQAPNGSIGFAWVEEIQDGTGKWKNNIWFAVLDAAGDVQAGPLNVTKNTAWASSAAWNVPSVLNARVAATPDNNFVLVWQEQRRLSDGWHNEIYYAVLEQTGKVKKAATRFTKSMPGQGFVSPTALALADGNVMFAFTSYGKYGQDIYFGVVNRKGRVVRAAGQFEGEENMPDWYYVDALQLENGNILLVWNMTATGTNPQILAAAYDSSFKPLSGTIIWDIEGMPLGNGPVSISPDGTGNAILTWHDFHVAWRHNLYYARLNDIANVQTPPMVFRRSETYITASFGGLGNAK